MWCLECSKECGEIPSHKCVKCGHYKSKHAKEKPPPAVKDDVPDWKKGLEQRKSRSPSPSPTPAKKDDKKEAAKDPPKKASIKKDAKKDEPKKEELKVKKEEPKKKDEPKKKEEPQKKEEPKKDPPKLEVRVEAEDKPKKRFFGSVFGEKEFHSPIPKNVSPLEVDFGEHVRSGWLLKLSHGIMSKFQKRYCMIRDGNLIYFSSKPKTENDVARKYIELEGYVPMVEEDPALLKKLGLKSQCVLFKLIHPVKPQYTFATDSEELLIEWVKALTTELYREFAVVHDSPVNEGALQKRFQPMQSVATIQAEDTTWERDLVLEKQMLEKRKAKKAALQSRNEVLVKSNTERIDALASKKEMLKKQVEQSTGSEKKKYQAELDTVRSQLASAVESGVMLSSAYHQDLEDLETPAQKPSVAETRRSISSSSTTQSRHAGLTAPESVSNSRNVSPRTSVTERSRPPLPPPSSPAANESPRTSAHDPASVKSGRGSASEPAPSPKAANASSSTPKAVSTPKTVAVTSTEAATPKAMSAIQQRKLELEKRDQEARAAAQASPRHTVVKSVEKPTIKAEPATPKAVEKPAPESKPSKEPTAEQALDAQAAALAKLEAAKAAKAAAVERMHALAAKERAKREAASNNSVEAKPAPEAADDNAKQAAEAERREQEREAAEEREKAARLQQELEEQERRLQAAEEQAAEQRRIAAAAVAAEEQRQAEAQQRKKEEEQQKKAEAEEERKKELLLEKEQQQRKADAAKREKEEQERRDKEKRDKEEREKREKEEREKREKDEREKREKDEKEKKAAAAAEAKRVEEKEAAERRKLEEDRKQQERKKEEKVSNTPRGSSNIPSSIPANSKVGKLPVAQYDSLPPGTKLTGMPAMLNWTQRMTRGFPGVKIKDFTKSWQDGLAFAALCANWRPDLMDYWSLDPADAQGNLEKAWVAAEKMGVAMLLDVEDMLEYQDSKSIMTQITMFHRALNHIDPAPRPWESGGSNTEFAARVVPKEVKNIVTLVQSFERRYNELNLKQVEAGEGEALFEALKSTLPKIEHWKAEFPDELSATIQLYNSLNRDLPTKVNDFLVEIAAKRKPGGSTSTCAGCLKPLSGKTVEAVNVFFHAACFKCEACQKPLTKTCINVNDKPYCDQCGRNALGR